MDEWVARIGPDAALWQHRARKRLAIGVGVFFGLIVIELALSLGLRADRNAEGVLALVGLVATVATAFTFLGLHWAAQAKAAVLAARFLDLSAATGETRLPRAALKSTTMFDNLMLRRNVSPKGRYKPHPSASWVANNQGRFGGRGTI